MRLRLAVAVAPLIAATACSSSTATTPAPAPGVASGPAAPSQQTADQIGQALKAHGLPIRNIVVLDENSDPHHLLGRPGGYTSKIEFADPAVTGKARAGGGNDVAHGGAIEVFTDPADAVKRGSFIQTIDQNIRIFGQEYDYAAGGVLLRLSGDVPPSRATKYAEALTALVGKPVVMPTPVHT